MRVVHVSFSDDGGGADIAARRMHLALLELGVDSRMLCQFASGQTPKSDGMKRRGRGFWARLGARLSFEFKKIQKDPTTGGISTNWMGCGLIDRLKKANADVVHLHWVGANTLRVEDFPRIPGVVVWTLHDMWPFCGAEHYAFEETRWRDGYTAENRPAGARGLDVNRWVWRRKMRAWRGLTVHTIGVSKWIDSCVRQSRLFRELKGERTVIGNGLELDIFHPRETPDSNTSATQSGAIRILFGAVSQLLPAKGTDLLLETLHHLKKLGIDFSVTAFGADVPAEFAEFGVNQAGYVREPEKMAALYQEADVFLMPSRYESFGQAGAEAMACGVPVVCFDATGLKDVVDHQENGYRAAVYDPEDLANGVVWVTSDRQRWEQLSRNARSKAEAAFSIAETARSTRSFYESLMAESPVPSVMQK